MALDPADCVSISRSDGSLLDSREPSDRHSDGPDRHRWGCIDDAIPYPSRGHTTGLGHLNRSSFFDFHQDRWGVDVTGDRVMSTFGVSADSLLGACRRYRRHLRNGATGPWAAR